MDRTLFNKIIRARSIKSDFCGFFKAFMPKKANYRQKSTYQTIFTIKQAMFHVKHFKISAIRLSKVHFL